MNRPSVAFFGAVSHIFFCVHEKRVKPNKKTCPLSRYAEETPDRFDHPKTSQDPTYGRCLLLCPGGLAARATHWFKFAAPPICA